MITNVVFDLGGVLVDFLPYEALKNMGFPEETADDLYERLFPETWEMADKYPYSAEELTEVFLKAAPGYENEIKEIVGHLSRFTTVRDFSYGWLKDLKDRGFGVYILSNYGKQSFIQNSPKYTFLSLADGAVISFEEQELKPDAEIYRILLKKYGLTASECVFIDDREKNVNGAKAVGMQGIVFDSFEQCSTELDLMLEKK